MFPYVLQVRTKQLGYFKLTGSPIRNGSHSAKRMVACVYTKKEAANKMLQLKVFITNAIQDQVQVRYKCSETLGQLSISLLLLKQVKFILSLHMWYQMYTLSACINFSDFKLITKTCWCNEPKVSCPKGGVLISRVFLHASQCWLSLCTVSWFYPFWVIIIEVFIVTYQPLWVWWKGNRGVRENERIHDYCNLVVAYPGTEEWERIKEHSLFPCRH